MGCDAPLGWNDSQVSYEREWAERGYNVNLLGDPFTCTRCGSEVRRGMIDTHDKFHTSIDTVQE